MLTAVFVIHCNSAIDGRGVNLSIGIFSLLPPSPLQILDRCAWGIHIRTQTHTNRYQLNREFKNEQGCKPTRTNAYTHVRIQNYIRI